MISWANSIICSRSLSVGAAPAISIMESISWVRYASISKLQALSSAIAAIATFTFSNDLSATALLKSATSAPQSVAAPGPVKARHAPSEHRYPLGLENILGLSKPNVAARSEQKSLKQSRPQPSACPLSAGKASIGHPHREGGVEVG